MGWISAVTFGGRNSQQIDDRIIEGRLVSRGTDNRGTTVLYTVVAPGDFCGCPNAFWDAAATH